MAGITFLIIFLMLMTMLSFIPLMLRRYHVPAVIAMLLVGMAIGPNAMDLIGYINHFLGRGYPTPQIYTVIDAIGLLGLVFLMALAGMEVSPRIIASEKKAVFWLSTLTFCIPCAAGYYVYSVFEPSDSIGKWVYASLFASHSVGIVFPVIRELNVSKTRFGIAVLASTIITDIASLVLLALCVQAKRHQMQGRIADSISVFDHIDPASIGVWFNVLFFAAILCFIALSLWLLPKLAGLLFSRILRPHEDAGVTFVLMGLLAVAMIGEFIGISVIVSVFVAGMALANVPALQDQSRVLYHKLEGIGHGFLVPFLFLSIGMKTDLRVIVGAWENLAIVAATVVALIASKVFSGWLGMRFAGFDDKRALCAGLMTVPQLSATLAAAAVALQLQMISQVFFNVIVCLSILTTIPIPMLTKFLIKFGKIRFEYVDDAVVGIPDIKIDEDTL